MSERKFTWWHLHDRFLTGGIQHLRSVAAHGRVAELGLVEPCSDLHVSMSMLNTVKSGRKNQVRVPSAGQ